MSTLYSLRVKPNWDPAFSPVWTDVTGTLPTDQLPSISIGAERADIPLTTVASDMSLSLNNADNRWDAILDVTKIIGTLPPLSGTIRAPLVHYGAVMFCRKATEQSQWEVVFFGFIDPSSVIFDRMEKTLALTAYAPGKLLDLGNAERVNRISAFFAPAIPARPFVMPLLVTHPAVPPGATATEDSWWKLTAGAQVPMLVSDQFEVVQSIATWVENMALTKIVDTVFNVIQVKPFGTDLYIQTAEAPDNLVLGGAVAQLSHLTPWYSGQAWEFIVAALVAEVNAAIAALGSSDVLVALLASLPLLPSNNNQITAQPIFSADAAPSITGVSMGKFGPAAPTGLFYTQETSNTATGKVAEKIDILTADSIAGTAPIFNDPWSDGSIPVAPDSGKTARVPSAQLAMVGSQVPDFLTDDIAMCGKDYHVFTNPGLGVGNFSSTMWCRAPTSFFAGSGAPKRFYRIYAFGTVTSGIIVYRGIVIGEYTTNNSGISWVLGSSTILGVSSSGAYSAPQTGRSTRPCFKVFWLGVNSFIYCWTNPFFRTAYVKTSTTDSQPASFFNPPPAQFNSGAAGSGPSGASGFVSETANGVGGNVFFFLNREDGTGVDFYYWNGSTFAAGTVINSSGTSVNLFGGDFINAVIDTQSFGSPPFTMYAMNGGNLMVLTYTFSGSTFTITKAQVVPIDTPNYDPQVEKVATSANNVGALAWIAGKVTQSNAGEPNYGAQPFAMIVGTIQKIYVVSSSPPSIVDYADFEQLSVAGALQQLILVRGYQMFTGAGFMGGAMADLIPDPSVYTPVPVLNFRQRLIASPSPIDVTAITEACQDGLWILNYSSCKVINSKDAPLLGPVYNHQTLTDLAGHTYSLKPPRYAGSSALEIDNRFVTTTSFAQLLADYFAQDFVLPQLSATIVLKDPYANGFGYVFHLLDVLTYLVKGADNLSATPITRRGRIFTIDYQLDQGLLTVKVQ